MFQSTSQRPATKNLKTTAFGVCSYGCSYTFFSEADKERHIKFKFAPNLAKKLSSLFYYLILLFQLSVANPENFKEFKGLEVLKIRKEKTGILPTSLVRYCNGGKNKSRQVCTLYQNSIS